MHKEIVELKQKLIIGLKVRTNNFVLEANPDTSRIGPVVGHYYYEEVGSTIPNRLHPGITLAAYTNYESDEKGDYDYFIGEEASSFQDIPKELYSLTIPAGRYVKFTTP